MLKLFTLSTVYIYTLTRLICAHRVTTYVRKIWLWNSKQLLRKLQKISWKTVLQQPVLEIMLMALV